MPAYEESSDASTNSASMIHGACHKNVDREKLIEKYFDTVSAFFRWTEERLTYDMYCKAPKKMSLFGWLRRKKTFEVRNDKERILRHWNQKKRICEDLAKTLQLPLRDNAEKVSMSVLTSPSASRSPFPGNPLQQQEFSVGDNDHTEDFINIPPAGASFRKPPEETHRGNSIYVVTSDRTSKLKESG